MRYEIVRAKDLDGDMVYRVRDNEENRFLNSGGFIMDYWLLEDAEKSQKWWIKNNMFSKVRAFMNYELNYELNYDFEGYTKEYIEIEGEAFDAIGDYAELENIEIKEMVIDIDQRVFSINNRVFKIK